MVFVDVFVCGFVNGDLIGRGEGKKDRKGNDLEGPGVFCRNDVWVVNSTHKFPLNAQVPQCTSHAHAPAIAGTYLPPRT